MTKGQVNNYTIADTMTLQEVIMHQLLSGLAMEEDLTLLSNIYPVITSTDGNYFSAVLITPTWYPLIELELVKHTGEKQVEPVKNNLSQELQSYFNTHLHNNNYEDCKEIALGDEPCYKLIVRCDALKKYSTYALNKFVLGNIGQAGRFVKNCLIEIGKNPQFLKGRCE